jgi:hypothetical protein
VDPYPGSIGGGVNTILSPAFNPTIFNSPYLSPGTFQSGIASLWEWEYSNFSLNRLILVVFLHSNALYLPPVSHESKQQRSPKMENSVMTTTQVREIWNAPELKKIDISTITASDITFQNTEPSEQYS